MKDKTSAYIHLQMVRKFATAFLRGTIGKAWLTTKCSVNRRGSNRALASAYRERSLTSALKECLADTSHNLSVVMSCPASSLSCVEDISSQVKCM